MHKAVENSQLIAKCVSSKWPPVYALYAHEASVYIIKKNQPTKNEERNTISLQAGHFVCAVGFCNGVWRKAPSEFYIPSSLSLLLQFLPRIHVL